MRALVVTPRRRASAELVELPEPAEAEGAVLVRARAVGICGEEAAHLTLAAARLLAAAGPALVGIDYLSVGGCRDPDGADVHRVLLGAGVWIVEGLDLTGVPAGPCEVACLPLRIPGADGAPARVLVRPRRG